MLKPWLKMDEDLLEVRMILGNPDTDPMILPVACNGVLLDIRVDTGVDKTVLGEKEWNSVKEKSDVNLIRSNICLVPYGTTDNRAKLPVKGKAKVILKAPKGAEITTEIIVMDGDVESLLGAQDAVALGYIAVHKAGAKEAVNKDALQQEAGCKECIQREAVKKGAKEQKDINEKAIQQNEEFSFDDKIIAKIANIFDKKIGGKEWEDFATRLGHGLKIKNVDRNKIRIKEGEVNLIDRDSEHESIKDKITSVVSLFLRRCEDNNIPINLKEHICDILSDQQLLAYFPFLSLNERCNT